MPKRSPNVFSSISSLLSLFRIGFNSSPQIGQERIGSPVSLPHF